MGCRYISCGLVVRDTTNWYSPYWSSYTQTARVKHHPQLLVLSNHQGLPILPQPLLHLLQLLVSIIVTNEQLETTLDCFNPLTKIEIFLAG